MTSTNRMVWLDALRLVAGLSMVCLHATTDAAGQPFVDSPAGDRVAPLLLRAVIYIARTELFMLIAVFLLLMGLDRRPRGYRATIAEQARRLLVPFLFWTVFYLGYNGVKAGVFDYDSSFAELVGDPLAPARFLLLGDVKYHMHFLPTLFGLVLAYPLFRKAIDQPALGLMVIACLAVRREVDQALWSALPDHPALPFLLRAVKIATYVGYGMVAGALLGLSRHVAIARLESLVAPLIYFGALLFSLKLVATVITIQTGRWPFDYAAGYCADFLMPVVLFAICLCLGQREWPTVLSRLAPYSFGIYLCHPIFIDLVEIALKDRDLSPIAGVAWKIGIALPATSLLVALIAHVRPLAWTIGLGPLPGWRHGGSVATNGAVGP